MAVASLTLTDLAHTLQNLRIAAIVNESSRITGGLSGAHLVGFTLLMGAALVSNLRLSGMLFADRPLTDITGPASRAIAIGLTISIATGLLLFFPRATTAIENWIFQLKMTLVLVAGVFHLIVAGATRRPESMPPALQRMAGVLSLAVWLGLALTACAFLLIE